MYSLNHFGGVAGEEVEYVFHRTHIGRLEEPQISHESVCFTRIGEFTWSVSDCEELVGQLPSLLLLPQFSTTISAAKLADNSFSTFSCIDVLTHPFLNQTSISQYY